MKRSGFRSKLPPLREAKQITYTPRPRAIATAVSGASTMATPVPKDNAVRSEEYRRLVAALPCLYCSIEGFSQHAHGNLGKGLSLKTDDRYAFPLCCTRPGELGCHARFDQGALFPKERRREIEPEWARRTVLTIITAGQWPAKLAVPDWAEA